MAEELTVTEFNQRVSSLVGYADAIHNISVVGEISNYSLSAAGHVYFTLNDKDSSVKCTLFRYAASRVGIKLANGMKVTVFGSASVYVKDGSLKFNVESVALFGKGELQKKLEELTAKLLKEGLFDPARKRPLPRFPKSIGVVTSPTGAVIKDIIDTTARRFPVDILLSPATVQGTDAPASIVSALELLEKEDVDIVIVGRGGGSKEDLSAFNDEAVVRAVVGCRVPVISAVGHATDKSLTDMAADVYAETPTAAAMLATPDSSEELRNINNLLRRAETSLLKRIELMRARFIAVDSKLSPKNAKVMLDSDRNRVDSLSHRADSHIMNKLSNCKTRFSSADTKLDPARMMDRVNQNNMYLDSVSVSMDRCIASFITIKRKDMEARSAILDGLDPMKVLSRGYSVVRDADGKVLTSISSVKEGMKVTIKMRDGEAVADVKEVRR